MIATTQIFALIGVYFDSIVAINLGHKMILYTPEGTALSMCPSIGGGGASLAADHRQHIAWMQIVAGRVRDHLPDDAAEFAGRVQAGDEVSCAALVHRRETAGPQHRRDIPSALAGLVLLHILIQYGGCAADGLVGIVSIFGRRLCLPSDAKRRKDQDRQNKQPCQQQGRPTLDSMLHFKPSLLPYV